MNIKLPTSGSYKFDFELPKFIITDGDSNEEVQPLRLFEDIDNAAHIWVQTKYLHVKLEPSVIEYLHQKRKISQLQIHYNGMMSSSYYGVIVETSFLKLSQNFTVKDDGECEKQEDDKYIHFTCQVVVKSDNFQNYSIPTRVIEVEFNNVNQASIEHSEMKEIFIRPLSNANNLFNFAIAKIDQVVRNVNDDIRIKDVKLTYHRKWAELPIANDVFYSEHEDIIELLRKECIGKKGCDVEVPEWMTYELNEQTLKEGMSTWSSSPEWYVEHFFKNMDKAIRMNVEFKCISLSTAITSKHSVIVTRYGTIDERTNIKLECPQSR